MISKKIKDLCNDYDKVENYQSAVADSTQVWDCHHRKEIDNNLSRKQLIENDDYYGVEPDELIFLTRAEHKKLHRKYDINYKSSTHEYNQEYKKTDAYKDYIAKKTEKQQQICVYEKKVYTLSGLTTKFFKAGRPHCYLLACKYLVK